MHTYCYDKDPFLAGCGISIEKEMTQVEGRVLKPPMVNLFMFCLQIERYDLPWKL